ncbi:MAG TPA: hypothetical protein VKG65_05170 [Terriglobales bacterium]|nr:hypothetical protein [Terriglobales bacterium]
MNVIRVPKPAAAPNRERPLSDLLKKQVEHFRHVEKKQLPFDKRTGIVAEAIRTEGEAAEYIRMVTEKLHRYAAKPADATGIAPAEKKVVRVPKPTTSPKHDRPISDLIRKQVEHFHHVEKKMLAPDQQAGKTVENIQTEGEAAEYIREVTAKLHAREQTRLRPAEAGMA